MPRLPFRFAAILTFAAASSLLAQSATPPDTPAGRALKAWLDAFDSGDSTRLSTWAHQYEPDYPIAPQAGFFRQTGGFDLIAIDRSEPRHIEFTVKERASTARNAFGTLDMSAGDPPQVTSGPALLAIGVGGTAAKLAIDASARRQAVDGMSVQLDSFYVFPDVAKKISDSLHARLGRGAYDGYTNGIVFARELNEEVRAISHDKHMGVQYAVNPIPVRPAGPPPALTPDQRARMQANMDTQNCGFDKVERLDQNIGYLKFDFFGDPQFCGATGSAVMNFLAGTQALIVDLRENGGGSPAMVTYMVSYLFNDSTHVNDLWDRTTGNTEQFWTHSVPGRKFGAQKPVFVLTAARTFSGAEEYTYDLKSLKRATVVGETTGGGAHPVGGRRASDHFMIMVPGMRAINPYTHTNWEGVGVEPDVKVPANDALATAIKLAATKLEPVRP